MRFKEFLGEQKYIQAQLLYPKNGLEPVMSKETIDYHHGHLHKSYVDRANKGEGGEFTKAGAYLHNIFFTGLLPKVTEEPFDGSKHLIDKKHGSFTNFKKKFKDVAMSIEGSGWVYMDKQGNIKTIANHKMVDEIALLVDWWEHAWALDYQHDKEQYLDKLWSRICFNTVNHRLMFSV